MAAGLGTYLHSNARGVIAHFMARLILIAAVFLAVFLSVPPSNSPAPSRQRHGSNLGSPSGGELGLSCVHSRLGSQRKAFARSPYADMDGYFGYKNDVIDPTAYRLTTLHRLIRLSGGKKDASGDDDQEPDLADQDDDEDEDPDFDPDEDDEDMDQDEDDSDSDDDGNDDDSSEDSDESPDDDDDDDDEAESKPKKKGKKSKKSKR